MSDNIDLSVTNFYNIINRFIDDKVPKLYFNKSSYPPWFNKQLICLLKRKDKAHNYKVYRKDRMQRGGGVLIYISQKITSKLIATDEHIEQLWINIVVSKCSINIGVIYRPPSTNLNHFMDVLETSLSHLAPSNDKLICTGDFNINYLDMNNSATHKLIDIFESFNLHQIIDKPTRINQSTSTSILIDLIVVPKDCTVLKADVISLHGISDHDLVSCNILLKTSKSVPTCSIMRSFRTFELESFMCDLRSFPLDDTFTLKKIDDKVSYLNLSLSLLYDQHAPFCKVRQNQDKVASPWLTDNIKLMISSRDKALQKYKCSPSPIKFNYYKQLRNHVTRSIRIEKKAYLEFRLRNTSNMWKELGRLNIYNTNKLANLPDNLRNVQLINKYFIESALPPTVDNQNLIMFYNTNKLVAEDIFFNFKPVDESFVQDITYSLKSNAMSIDEINLKMLLLACPYIVIYLKHICNCSLTGNYFPRMWKHSKITPIPKISSPSEFAHLRPISILPTASKIMEKIMEHQLRIYLHNNSILPNFQSGFRADHSCATALLSVTDDIIREIDKGNLTLLVLLDYSKAFDTINHNVLLSILRYIDLSTSARNLFKRHIFFYQSAESSQYV